MEQYILSSLNNKNTFVINSEYSSPTDSLTYLAEIALRMPEFNQILLCGPRQNGKTTSLLRVALELLMSHDNFGIGFVCSSWLSLRQTRDMFENLVKELCNSVNCDLCTHKDTNRFNFLNGSTIYFTVISPVAFCGMSFNCVMIDNIDNMLNQTEETIYAIFPTLVAKNGHVLIASATKPYLFNSLVSQFV